VLVLAANPLEPAHGVLEGNIGITDEWLDLSTPSISSRLLQVFIGDAVCGPALFFYDYKRPPSGQPVPRDWGVPLPPHWPADQSDQYTHYHRTDVWRFQVADRDKEYFSIGPKKLHFADYYLQPANTWYIQTPGPDGLTAVNLVADRRGSTSIDPLNRHLRGKEFVDCCAASGLVSEASARSMHDDDAKAVSGLASTTGLKIPKAGLIGSLLDTTGWTTLPDGSRICAIFQADPLGGPMILLSHNAPGAVEARAGRYGSDTVRIILKGSCRVGGHVLGPLEFRALNAATEEDDVVHGDDGSVQVQYVADRRGWRSSGSDQSDARAGERAAELQDLLAPFVG
jgi:hypothetical protein